MIDRSQYTNAPMGTIDETVTLGQTLVTNFEAKKKEKVEKKQKVKENLVEAIEYLEGRIAAVQALQVAQAKQVNVAPSAVDPTAIDQVADRYWRALKLRLEAAAMLPAGHADVAHASFALQRIFGDDGLEFLNYPHAAQYNQMKVHLVPLFGDEEGKDKEPGLLETVNRLVGDGAYVEAIVGHMPVYGEMVMGKATSNATSTVVVAPVHRELQEAIVDFAMAVISNAKRGSAEVVAEAKQLLLPIDNARAKARESAAAKRAKVKVIEAGQAKVPGVPAGNGGVEVSAEVVKAPAVVVETKTN